MNPNNDITTNERQVLEDYIPKLDTYSWKQLSFDLDEEIWNKYPDVRYHIFTQLRTTYLSKHRYVHKDKICSDAPCVTITSTHIVDAVQWVIENLNGNWTTIITTNGGFIFESKEDALRFKMVWG